MAWDVHLHVCFPCCDNNPVAKLATQFLPSVAGDRDAENFLKDLASRSGHNKGYKGGLSLWGYVGNHSDGDRFVDILRPFWLALFEYGRDEGDQIVLDFERVLVFVEEEQSERAIAYEIGLDGEVLKINKHECPFSWGQY